MKLNSRTLYKAMTAGGAIGLVASILQTIEKFQLLEETNKALVCDLNSVFSCTNVLNAWQSSLFGFPNSLLCMVFFTIFMTVGLAGWASSSLSRSFRLGVHALAVFVLGFGLWFLRESTYSIGALCLYCLFCFGGLILVNAAFLRLNVNDLSILGPSAHKKLKSGIASGADLFGWALFAVIIAFLMALKFY